MFGLGPDIQSTTGVEFPLHFSNARRFCAYVSLSLSLKTNLLSFSLRKKIKIIKAKLNCHSSHYRSISLRDRDG
jgi:hypothetical protein